MAGRRLQLEFGFDRFRRISVWSSLDRALRAITEESTLEIECTCSLIVAIMKETKLIFSPGGVLATTGEFELGLVDTAGWDSFNGAFFICWAAEF
jgi:hypothetical protein